MLRSLYARLAAVVVGLVLVLGLIWVGLTVWLTGQYRHEVDQRLNAGLAEHLAADLPLMRGGEVNEEALKEAFHMLMVINPSIEIYLLDTRGSILAFSAPPGTVVRERIDLAPVKDFLEDGGSLVLGDDPRHESRRKPFSAAPLEADGIPQGYLYVVLGGQLYDSAAQAFRASHILRLGAAAAGVALVLGLVVGLLLLRLVTRRLRLLSAAMERFRRDELASGPPLPEGPPGEPRDEVDRLAQTYHRMARRIEGQVAELEKTDALRRELVANVSHDLRTPLAALRGYLETLQLKSAELDEARRAEYLAVALRHAERLGRLVDDLFELAKLDARDTPPDREPFRIGELVQDVVQTFRVPAEERGVQLEAELNDDSPFVEAEIGLIERVLANLIDNGIRHTPPGGRVHVGLERHGDGVDVRVKDTGCGIPADELPRVFDRFYRGRDETGAESGSGLGLAISRRIVELHGSRLEAESAPGRGSTFRFRLPGPSPAP